MRRRMIASGQARFAVAATEFGPEAGPLDVLFLHANGFNALTYRHVFAELHPSLRLLAVDLRGHGLTTLPPLDPHPGWQVYADDVVALVDALGQAPRILAGHSMGATAALLAAPRLPKAGHLMLFDPVIAAASLRAEWAGRPMDAHPLAQGALRRRARFASLEEAFECFDGRGAFRTWQDAMLRDYVQDGLRPDAGGFALACEPVWEAANFANFASGDPLAALLASEAQVTVFRAAHGSTCGVDEAAVPASARRRVSMATLPGTSHFLPMERPGIVCKALLDAGP